MKCEIVITPKDPERVVLYVREPDAGAEALADKINHLLEKLHLLGPLIRLTGLIISAVAVQMVIAGCKECGLF